MRFLFIRLVIAVRIFFLGLLSSILLITCSTGSTGKIEAVTIENTIDNNALMKIIKVKCTKKVNAYVEYWQENTSGKVFKTMISGNSRQHKICLTNLDFEKIFQFRIIIKNGEDSLKSKLYTFRTPTLPEVFSDIHLIREVHANDIPQEFISGCVLLYKRDPPGCIMLVDYNGAIRWYKNINTRGVKAAHFTKDKTILSILSTLDYPNSYGNEIVEFSLTGDAVCHLKKGENDFQQTIHHEVVLDNKNQIVTLSTVDTVMNLRSSGGSAADTVRGDGIIVLNKQGKKIWGWSVFNELNPLLEKDISKERKDWMHANSLSIDAQGNYIISFYKSGQIWKIDSQTGKVIWKFGRKGDYFIPPAARFNHVHAVHMDRDNCLRLFDNGIAQQQSQSWAFTLNEKTKQAELKGNTKLPEGVFTDRMGSAYRIGENTLLTCISKQHYIYLTRLNGDVLWKMFCVNTPYRAEFIPMSELSPFIFK